MKITYHAKSLSLDLLQFPATEAEEAIHKKMLAGLKTKMEMEVELIINESIFGKPVGTMKSRTAAQREYDEETFNYMTPERLMFEQLMMRP